MLTGIVVWRGLNELLFFLFLVFFFLIIILLFVLRRGMIIFVVQVYRDLPTWRLAAMIIIVVPFSLLHQAY
jgi:hypothetical protein